MATMDIFHSSAFSMVSLTGAFQKLDYKPQLLGDLGVFEEKPTRTRSIAIERRNGFLALVPTTPVGAPVTQLKDDKRDIRDFRTVRLAKGFTVYAEELNGIRQFGTETELMQVQDEVARRGLRVRNDLELTEENLRLGALRGIVYDADGVTVIRNWYTEWGIAPPAPVNFALDVTTTDVRTICNGVVRGMSRVSKGAFTPATTVHALVGDTFFDMLIAHRSVRDTYLNWSSNADLRAGTAFQAFVFGGITWHNYRGTDDLTSVAVAPEDARFFPMDAPDVFQVARGPAEFEPFINTPGQPLYALSIPDLKRQAYQELEAYEYPLDVEDSDVNFTNRNSKLSH